MKLVTLDYNVVSVPDTATQLCDPLAQRRIVKVTNTSSTLLLYLSVYDGGVFGTNDPGSLEFDSVLGPGDWEMLDIAQHEYLYGKMSAAGPTNVTVREYSATRNN